MRREGGARSRGAAPGVAGEAVVRQRPPGSGRLDPLVPARLDARVAVQRAEPHPDVRVAVGVAGEQVAAAVRAERLRAPVLRAPGAHGPGPANGPEPRGGGRAVRGPPPPRAPPARL